MSVAPQQSAAAATTAAPTAGPRTPAPKVFSVKAMFPEGSISPDDLVALFRAFASGGQFAANPIVTKQVAHFTYSTSTESDTAIKTLRNRVLVPEVKDADGALKTPASVLIVQRKKQEKRANNVGADANYSRLFRDCVAIVEQEKGLPEGQLSKMHVSKHVKLLAQQLARVVAIKLNTNLPAQEESRTMVNSHVTQAVSNLFGHCADFHSLAATIQHETAAFAARNHEIRKQNAAGKLAAAGSGAEWKSKEIVAALGSEGLYHFATKITNHVRALSVLYRMSCYKNLSSVANRFMAAVITAFISHIIKCAIYACLAEQSNMVTVNHLETAINKDDLARIFMKKEHIYIAGRAEVLPKWATMKFVELESLMDADAAKMRRLKREAKRLRTVEREIKSMSKATKKRSTTAAAAKKPAATGAKKARAVSAK